MYLCKFGKMNDMRNVPFRSVVAAVLSAVMLLAFQSCKSQYELMLESHDIPAKYKMAFDLFDAGKYAKAAGMFESLKIAVGGTAQDDTVQYYTAYSHESVCRQSPFYVSGLPVQQHVSLRTGSDSYL